MKRHASLVRRHPMRPSGKPLNAVGKGLAKRKARTRKARQSAHTKQWRLDVLARDGHRCTAVLANFDGESFPSLWVFAVGEAETYWEWRFPRCVSAENLHVHHVTSKRMGAELLEDGATLCQSHHEYIESQIRWWKVRP